MKNFRPALLSVCALSLLSTACINQASTSKAKIKSNYITNKSSQSLGNLEVNEKIGDQKLSFQILSLKEFMNLQTAGVIVNPHSKEARESLEDAPQASASAKSIARAYKKRLSNNEESLLLSFPIGLIGQQSIFGGVITKVSDSEREDIGTLKLTDLTPLHVRTVVTPTPEGGMALTLVGCASACEEDSQQMPLVSFPIVGVNSESSMIVVDLAAIGKELDLMKMLDPMGDYTKLRSVSSATTAFDYSYSTLVFDIKTNMVPVESTDENAPITSFTVRWYLKLTSAFNPAFTARSPKEGVGFFKTERSKESKITRFSTTNFGQTVKYYIKNVPSAYRDTFAHALDNWNGEFKKIIGREFLSYEFLESTDERFEQIVPGDIRYNVIEWDVDNIASYGGLGPSIANQFTGETLSANVLIQGPTIISLYTKWFELSKTARNLMANGQTVKANELMANFHRSVDKEIKSRNQTKFSLKLGSLDMTVRAQKDELEDPMIKNHFELVPEGVSFEKYMNGYFTEMLEHELGHNLGLRHNFKGNLGAYENGEKGSVSRSIMEYLGRPYRYLSAIGLYDKMAISYGYKGLAPKHLDWFCTDEDQASSASNITTKSPECSKSDATSDPFSYWEGRLNRALDLILDTQSASAPVWKTAEISSNVDEAVLGLSAYAASADKTALTWTNFFGKGERPESAAELKTFVLGRIKNKICDPTLKDIIINKETPEAVLLAQSNLDELKKTIAKKTTDLGVYTADDLNCN